MKYFLMAFKKYAVFSGRASRAEYWYFFLFNIIFAVISILLSETIYLIYMIATLIPHISLSVRRLHDVNKSGWTLLVSLIPLVNIWIFILTITKGNQEENRYGKAPIGIK